MHFHRELFDAYVRELGRVLKPGALLHLHYAKRRPGVVGNERVFQYREDGDLEALFASASFRLTNRQFEFRGGFGSILREAIRLLQ